MPIQALKAPRRRRDTGYSYDQDDAQQAYDLLQEGEEPGDTGFETPGKARNAAEALRREMEEITDVSAIGSRVFETDDGFAFVLKNGRKQRGVKED